MNIDALLPSIPSVLLRAKLKAQIKPLHACLRHMHTARKIHI